MKSKTAASILSLLLAGLLAACGEQSSHPPASANHTAVLGGSAGPQANASEPLVGANGQAIPPAPGVPHGERPAMVRIKDDSALALWLQDGHVVTATWTQAAGWTAGQPIEQIFGEASDPQLATDGRGTAMAIWRHTVGDIQSLRYSRFDAAGWSVPDVMPGALPRARNERGAAPRLEMDTQGHASAEWASGFDPKQTQVAHYQAGQGWTQATNEVASASNASPAPPPPSSAR